MLFEMATADTCVGDELILKPQCTRWAVDSEYGRLLDVALSLPSDSIREHPLVKVLQSKGVRCRIAPPDAAGLTFIRDAALMTAWGLLELSPGAGRSEMTAARLMAAAEGWSVSRLCPVDGRIRASDVCILRPGLVAIGWSGESTDESGARALALWFESRGWRTIVTRFDPYFSRLDTLFTLVDQKRAVACLEALDPAFVNRLWMLGLELVPMTIGEVQTLGANLVSLGNSRILSGTDNKRLNGELVRRGYEVNAVELDAFTRDCGGIRRLVLPLAREPG